MPNATPPGAPATPRPGSAAPESLDQVTETTKPHGWWALWAIAAAVAIALVWSIVATIPQQVSATGVVSSFNYSTVVASPIAGTVTFSSSLSGSVTPDSTVATVTPYGGGTPVDIPAGVTGAIGSIDVSNGQGVEAGATIAKVVTTPDPSSGIIIVTYVPAADATTYSAGESAGVTVTNVALNTTSVVTATIMDVANSPSSLAGMETASGSSSLAQEWMTEADGTPYRIILSITDWPADVTVPAAGEVVSIVNTYGTIHPIQLLFGGK